jgi:23S rRNA (cytidine1920-2'-O)/16S rRNA (cytidine1409-2'-O)-methyltransferase
VAGDRAGGKKRLDQLLVERGLAETRERAHSLILSGAVAVNGQPAGKPGQAVGTEARLTVERTGREYVSRGAYKLIAALEHWRIDPGEKVCLDVGASTGGFTDVLLERGARRVYAVDVGYGQLHYRLRTDPRVVSLERTNVRYLEQLPEPIELAVADVSFISLRLALPPVFKLLKPEATLITLVKPQFEAGRSQVGRGGVVRDPGVHQLVLNELEAWSASQPWHLLDTITSPIKGPAGNTEFLSVWRG